jgi:SAM-dependent methyltransferase
VSQLTVGAPRSLKSCSGTVEVVVGILRSLSKLSGRRLLDVGCANGTFTRALAEGFEEVHGIDIQERWLSEFRGEIPSGSNLYIHNMSAEQMAFPDATFDVIVSIETIEHIRDLPAALAEMFRVLRPGGECLITCPNRLFPFENHGICWKGKEISGRVPFLTYLPWLHDRIGLARVFTVRSLDKLFLRAGFRREAVRYAWPTFEHGGNPLQKMLRPLLAIMRLMERSPFQMFGTSIVVKYSRPG